jgi:hypothetical protein
MSENQITAKAYWMPAKRVKFVAPITAGWVVKSPETGRSLSPHRYSTEAEALADAPRVLAAHLDRVRQHASSQPVNSEPAGPGRAYTEVRSSLYGPGRVYADQPGATQYDDGSGRYSIQIWDNS